MDETDFENELAITGTETADHSVPAEVLARTLDGLQRIVYLMAASAQNLPIGDRFNPGESLRSKNTLRCGLPRKSSYAIPIQMKDASQPRLFPGPEPLAETLKVFQLAAEGRWIELNHLFSRPKYLSRVLSELRELLPKSGERWGVRLLVGREEAVVDQSTSRSLSNYLASTASEDATMTVTGDLLKVHIEDHRLIIRYPLTRTEIPCQCDPSVFDTVMRNYDVPIQVTGLYTLDRRGHPIRLTGVTRVEPIDLSPLTFSRVEWAGRTLTLQTPLVLEPSMDEESKQFYVLIDEELGIDVFARTRDELSDEFAEQLLFQWDTYAREDPARLSKGARRLQAALLANLREENVDATPSKVR